MKKVLKVVIVVALLIGVFYLGKSFGDPNKKLEYGSTGSNLDWLFFDYLYIFVRQR